MMAAFHKKGIQHDQIVRTKRIRRKINLVQTILQAPEFRSRGGSRIFI